MAKIGIPCSAACCAASRGSVCPSVFAPSESRTMITGESSESPVAGATVGATRASGRSAFSCEAAMPSTIPSPMAVPPVGFRASMAASTASLSVVGATTVRTPAENVTSEIRNPSGSSFTSKWAASWAAANRVGRMSVAVIEPETSVTRTIVASCLGTLCSHSGPTQRNEQCREREQAQNSREVASPVRRLLDDVGEEVQVGETGGVLRPPVLRQHIEGHRERYEDQGKQR